MFRFDRSADKKIVTESIQPDQYSQSTLNNKLGIRTAGDAVQPYVSIQLQL